MEYLTAFRQYLNEYNPQYSEHTIRGYWIATEDFLKFLSKRYFNSCLIDSIPLAEIDSLKIEDYLDHLSSTPIARRSINTKLVAVRRFCDFLCEQGISEDNIARQISGLEMPELNVEDFLSVEEVKQLLNFVPQTDMEVRDKAIMETIYSSMLRTSELAQLKLDDLDLIVGMVRIMGKRGKSRVIPLGQYAVAAVRQYLEVRPILDMGLSEGRLFLSVRGRMLSERDFHRIVTKYAERLWPKRRPPVSPITLRYSATVHMYDREASLKDIEELLDESSAFSKIYRYVNTTRPSPNQLRANYEKAHPHALEPANLKTVSHIRHPIEKESTRFATSVKEICDVQPLTEKEEHRPCKLVIGLHAIAAAGAEARKINVALMDAVLRDQIETIRSLINKGADVNTEDIDGRTPIVIAASLGYIDAVRILLDHGAEIDAKDKYGATALIWAARNGYVGVVQSLLDHGANVNEKTSRGQTALMGAAQNGHADIVRALLENGADVNAQDKFGNTALRWAQTGPAEIVQMLKGIL